MEADYSAAQIEAFEDTWHWSPDVTEREYDELLRGPDSDVSEMMKAPVAFLGRNDMTANQPLDLDPGLASVF